MAIAPNNADLLKLGVQPGPSVRATSYNFAPSYDAIKNYKPEVLDTILQKYDYDSMEAVLETMGATAVTNVPAARYYWLEAGTAFPVVKAGVGYGTTIKFDRVSDTTGKVVSNDNTKKLPFKYGDRLQIASGTKINYAVVVTKTPSYTIDVVSYSPAVFSLADDADVIVTKVGNDQIAGSLASDMKGALEINVQERDNYFKISRGHADFNGSELTNKNWHQLNGDYFWTDQSIELERMNFNYVQDWDMLTSEKILDTSGAYGVDLRGMEGVFPAIRNRGMVNTGFDGSLVDITAMFKALEIAGAPMHNMLFCSGDMSRALDIAWSKLNPNGGTAGNINYGDFGMSNDQVLKLGFKGLEWGSFVFHKKTLGVFTNIQSPLFGENTNNAAGTVEGFTVPMGTTPIKLAEYEYGVKNVPYLTKMFKGGNGEDRSMKSTMIDFKVNGDDKMSVEFLAEFSVRTACANKFMLFEKA